MSANEANRNKIGELYVNFVKDELKHGKGAFYENDTFEEYLKRIFPNASLNNGYVPTAANFFRLEVIKPPEHPKASSSKYWVVTNNNDTFILPCPTNLAIMNVFDFNSPFALNALTAITPAILRADGNTFVLEEKGRINMPLSTSVATAIVNKQNPSTQGSSGPSPFASTDGASGEKGSGETSQSNSSINHETNSVADDKTTSVKSSASPSSPDINTGDDDSSTRGSNPPTPTKAGDVASPAPAPTETPSLPPPASKSSSAKSKSSNANEDNTDKASGTSKLVAVVIAGICGFLGWRTVNGKKEKGINQEPPSVLSKGFKVVTAIALGAVTAATISHALMGGKLEPTPGSTGIGKFTSALGNYTGWGRGRG